MRLAHVWRLLHTVRHLTALQIVFRIYYRLRPRLAVSVEPGQQRRWPHPWSSPEPLPPSMAGPDLFEFLGERGVTEYAEAWKGHGRSRLWMYNLHYLDDLNARDSQDRVIEHRRLVSRWIAENPPAATVGWEPYPLSLRIVNLVKWFARQPDLEPEWVSSLATQARALSRSVEYHLLGNHLIANAKGLVFAGVFLDGAQANQWLSKGLRLLDAQLAEQFLGDGGHFERSPMYHSGILWDLCDLLNLARTSCVPALTQRRGQWTSRLQRGLSWLDAMTHPDGEIGFFNDAAFCIAPRLSAIREYAAAFLDPEVPSSSPTIPSFACRVMEDSGYCRIDLPDQSVGLLDLAPIGPDYLPGHGHADTLSFELSLLGRRVFVNSGTSLYGEDAERLRQRGTRAHNTVAVDDADSSEVWAGFRVGRRARPSVTALRVSGEEIVVAASHDGYRRLPGRNTHHRRWAFTAASLQLDDEVEGRFRSARAYFHLHPDVTIAEANLADGRLVLDVSHGIRVDFSVEGGSLGVAESTWHPRFGAAIPSRCLVANFRAQRLKTRMHWRRTA